MRDFIDLAEVLPYIDGTPSVIRASRQHCDDCGCWLDWSEDQLCLECDRWNGQDPIEWLEEEG